MAADGSIIVEAIVDDKKAQAELNRLTKEIDKLGERIKSIETVQAPLIENAKKLEGQIAEARAEVKRYGEDWKAGVVGADAQQEDARDRLRKLTEEYEKILSAIEKQDVKLAPLLEKYDELSTRAGQLSQALLEGETAGSQTLQGAEQMAQGIDDADTSAQNLGEDLRAVGDEGENAGDKISNAVQALGKRIDRIGSRISRLIGQVFFISVLTRAISGAKKYFTDIVKSNDEAAQAIGRLKGAFLTLAQPIVEIIIPRLIQFINLLARVVSAIASFVARVFGTTASEAAKSAESLYDEQKAIKGVGSAAKKASGQLAAFDQLNVLSETDTGGSGGGGAGIGEIEPSFEALDIEEDKLRTILDIVTLIGAGLLAWKLSQAFGLGLQGAIGIALTLWGTLKFIREYIDAWDNGISAENLEGLLLGLAALATGLFLAFGKVAGAIGLVVGGIALLVLGFKDIVENGITLENKLTVIAGLLALGLGIGVLTGSWIPLLIAAIISVGVYFADLAGAGEDLREGLTKVFEGFAEFFKAVFVDHDMKAAGEALKKIWEGIGQTAGAIVEGIKYAWQLFIEWLSKNASPEIAAIFKTIGEVFGDVWEDAKEILGGFIDFFTGVFTGDWAKAWDGFKEIGRGAINLIIDLFEGFLNIGYNLVNLLLSAVNSISIKIPDWVPIFGGKTFAPNIPINKNMKVTLPRLAEGAVIPPNREFLAVLGDQKRGTNIEAPLETIVQAFRQALSENRGQQDMTVRVYLDSREIYAGQQRYGRAMGV